MCLTASWDLFLLLPCSRTLRPIWSTQQQQQRGVAQGGIRGYESWWVVPVQRPQIPNWTHILYLLRIHPTNPKGVEMFYEHEKRYFSVNSINTEAEKKNICFSQYTNLSRLVKTLFFHRVIKTKLSSSSPVTFKFIVFMLHWYKLPYTSIMMQGSNWLFSHIQSKIRIWI